MSTLVEGALVALVLFLHWRAAERWDAERARLLAALTAPDRAAAHAALRPEAPRPERDERPPLRRPIGEG